MPIPTAPKLSSAAAILSHTRVEPARRAFHLVLAVGFVAIAAQLAVPIPGTPVPVTMQDLAVLVVGVLLGPVGGATALGGYLAVGALGAPVFSNGHGGFAWLLGPSGGYLLAYPMAAWVMGTIASRARATEREGRSMEVRGGAAAVPGEGTPGSSSPAIRRRSALALLGALAAQAVIFGGGLAQLLLLTSQEVGSALALGVYPFIPGVVVKTGLLVAFVATLERFGPSPE
ncbi:MAG: biotin transporter BioY [Longimicrobiales bacterium]|nr:biotin transporter BioY [Longimicrobiales bacterium]